MTSEQVTYQQELSRFWWLLNPRYTLYFLRELSSLFIGINIVLLALLLTMIPIGAQAYSEYLTLLQSPPFLILHIVSLFFAVLHSVTWFNLIPRVQPVQIGGWKIPQHVVFGVFILLWLVVSGIIYMLFGE